MTGLCELVNGLLSCQLRRNRRQSFRNPYNCNQSVAVHDHYDSFVVLAWIFFLKSYHPNHRFYSCKRWPQQSELWGYPESSQFAELIQNSECTQTGKFASSGKRRNGFQEDNGNFFVAVSMRWSSCFFASVFLKGKTVQKNKKNESIGETVLEEKDGSND